MPLFRRPDGTLIKAIAPVRRIMPFIMRTRNESSVYHESTYDVTKSRQWLRAWNREKRGQNTATLFHLFLWSVVQAGFKNLGLNRFVSGGNLYQRKGFYISFAAKREMTPEAPLVTVKLEFFEDESFEDCVKRIRDAINTNRDDQNSPIDRELRLAAALPSWLLLIVMSMWRLLDFCNLLPGALIRIDPMYTSIFVANLGSVGLDRTYHHLFNYGTAGLFACLGTPKKLPSYQKDGTPVTRDLLDVRWTLDERVNDGFYSARSLELFKTIFENPHNFIK